MTEKWHNLTTERLCRALLSLNTVEECYSFLEDICTIKEIIDISQRLEVAGLLKQGVSYATISQETGVSTATISRVAKCLDYGNGGYEMILQRMKDEDAQ